MTLNDDLTAIRERGDDPKRVRILEGATKVFLAYGFQRTTMDDIARAAEISRPALYLLFRNKTDIYRALASEFMQEALAQARVAIAAEGSLGEKLENAIRCAFEKMLEIEQSPHGAEILDMKSSLAADIVTAGRGRMGAMMEQAIAAEADRTGADLPARGLSASALADMLLDALDGMKMRRLPAETQARTTRQFVAVIASMLR